MFPPLSRLCVPLVLAVIMAACSDSPPKQAAQPATETRPPASATAPRTATPAPTVPAATPTRTATPPPTPTALLVTAPTFIVNSLPVGCHREPATGAPVVAQRAPGSVQAMDQTIRQADGTWYREVGQGCWTRTDPGPVQMFGTLAAAEGYAATLRPTPTRTPSPTAAPTPAPRTATPALALARNCSPAYPDICIPPPPPDLDCKDIPYRRFRVLPPDPHRLDADRDGIGCES